MIKSLRYYFLRRYISIQKEVEWFSNIEKYRQQGFYSDYDTDIITSSRVSQDDYDAFYGKILGINSLIKTYMEFFENGTAKEKLQLIVMKKAIQGDGTIYREAGNFIVKINHPKFDSYGTMKNMLEEMFQYIKGSMPSEFFGYMAENRGQIIKNIKKIKKLERKTPSKPEE